MLVIVLEFTPSVYIKLQGPVPVKATFKLVLLPLHIEDGAVTEIVGIVLTTKLKS